MDSGDARHGLIIVSERTQDPYREPVPVTNRTIQCTEPIASAIERWKQGERPAREQIDGARFEESREAFGHFEYDAILGVPVQLDDGTVLLVDPTINQTDSG